MCSDVCKKYRIQPVSDFNSTDKTVFLRVDFNVPIDENFSIVDDSRVRAAARTIEHLLENKSKIIVVSHLGDPKQDIAGTSFRKIIKQLEEILKCKIHLAPKGSLDEISHDFEGFNPISKEIFMLDNIRSFSDEKANSKDFGADLIKKLKIDVYVNDAFPVCHRSHASVVAIPELLSEKYAGFALVDELKALEKNLGNLNNSSVVTAIIGGKKVSTKILLLESLAQRIKNIVIVGGMANTFLKASDIDVGNSFYEPEMLPVAAKIMKQCNVLTPADVICKTNSDAVKEIIVGSPIEGSICDIGPKTNHLIDQIIRQSDVVVWNGPAGIYEDKRFVKGSESIAKSLAESTCVSIIGGGDTAAVINQMDLKNKIDHISNGGGAFIAWLEGSPMPGIESLQIKN